MDPTVYTAVPEWNWTYLLAVHKGKSLAAAPFEPASFRLHLVNRGAIALKRGGSKLIVHAPFALCAGSRDVYEFDEDDISCTSIVFHPAVINDAFLSQDVYDRDSLTGTTRNDQFYLHPFTERSDTYLGLVGLTPVTMLRVQSLAQHMARELGKEDPSFWPCKTRSWFLELLMYLRKCYESAPTALEDVAQENQELEIEQVVLHLHAHYAERITIPELAAAFATNRTSLANLFHKHTGTSIGTYLGNLRIRVAQMMLKNTTLPIEEIIGRAGFQDRSHFSRTFRRETGTTPAAYRKEESWLAR